MDDVQLERRLTLMEANASTASQIAASAVSAAMAASSAQHAQVIGDIGRVREEVKEVKDVVKQQNGRVGKMEVWKVQMEARMAILIAAGPFVFWALNKWA